MDPLHVARRPDTSAIAVGEGGGEEGPWLAVVLPEERLDREWMKEARALKNAMTEEFEDEATKVKEGKSSSVPFHDYLNG